jgi:hypothetical protein
MSCPTHPETRAQLVDLALQIEVLALELIDFGLQLLDAGAQPGDFVDLALGWPPPPAWPPAAPPASGFRPGRCGARAYGPAGGGPCCRSGSRRGECSPRPPPWLAHARWFCDRRQSLSRSADLTFRARRPPPRSPLHTGGRRRMLHLGQRGHGGGIVRIGEVGHVRHARDRLAQDLQPLAAFIRRKGGINKCADRFTRCLGLRAACVSCRMCD